MGNLKSMGLFVWNSNTNISRPRRAHREGRGLTYW